ncbi:MAG: nucleotidyl transferase AbiEii/AbiGii toxin family protein [Crocinitomicaceae bacterium]|nr:nucleotidyl transferase AbiEii/AbiGii toxin family protein [Crocinitomicaceae bacterium]
MIPKPYIAQWKDHVPWNSFEQVEQDLVISRVLVEIFSDEFLNENLAFRGGTALHKLYLNPAPRYSEDIDLVQIKPGPIKPIMERLNEVIAFFDETRNTMVKGHGAKANYRFTSEHEGIRLRLKLEINCKEHFNVLPWVYFPFEITNPWFTGKTNILTYDVNELLGTKLRALYQRKKGRDLFDLDYSRLNMKLDMDKIIESFNAYMKFSVNSIPTKRQFILNLEEKEQDQNFLMDMDGLIRSGISYNQKEAFEWIKEEVLIKLR